MNMPPEMIQMLVWLLVFFVFVLLLLVIIDHRDYKAMMKIHKQSKQKQFWSDER